MRDNKMKHQRIRKIVQMISTVLFLPISLWIICSPILVILLGKFNYDFVMINQRIGIGLWGVVFISSFIFKRAYCGHLCPVTGVFTLVSYIKKSKDVMTMSYPKITKYIVLSLWGLSFLVVLCVRIVYPSAIDKVQTIYMQPETLIYYGLYFVSAILSVTYGKSKTEHYICPFAPWMTVGMKVVDKYRLPSLRIVTNKDACKNCNQCSKNCSMGLEVHKMVSEKNFQQEECINCGACVESCKSKAIYYSWYTDVTK